MNQLFYIIHGTSEKIEDYENIYPWSISQAGSGFGLRLPFSGLRGGLSLKVRGGDILLHLLSLPLLLYLKQYHIIHI